MKGMIPKRHGGHEMDPKVPICRVWGKRPKRKAWTWITSAGRGRGYSGSWNDSLMLGNGPQQHSGLDRGGTGKNHPHWAVSVQTPSHPVLTGPNPDSEKEQVPHGQGLLLSPRGWCAKDKIPSPCLSLLRTRRLGRKRTQMNESDLQTFTKLLLCAQQ